MIGEKKLKKVIYLAFLVFILFGSYVFYLNRQSQLPTAVIDGVTWTQVLYWVFEDGFYPTGWGRGNWSIVDGMLEGRESEGGFSLYFFPFTHGGDFILETKVKILEGLDGDVEVQLLTRDSDKINFESGMVLFAGWNKVTVRHMADKIDYVYRPFGMNMTVNYGEWYVMRFVVYKGIVRAFVNEVQVYASNDSYPVGEYHEPHLAVRYAIAAFEYVKIFVTS